MKLAEHNILSLRCAMTQLGYRWRRDQSDRSLRWQDVDHWELWATGLDIAPEALVLHPVVDCRGDLITTDVACTVQIRPDQTLGRWELTESYAGTGKEFDPRRYSLEELPGLLRDWVMSWEEEERRPLR
jgi:hypothetical protein